MRQFFFTFLLFPLILGSVTYASRPKLSPLADALKRLYIDSRFSIETENPFNWGKDWWKNAGTEAQWKAAFEELKSAYPGEVDALIEWGRVTRAHYLKEQLGAATANWEKWKPENDQAKKLMQSLEVLVVAEKQTGLAKLRPVEIEPRAIEETLNTVNGARLLEPNLWKNDAEVEWAYKKARNKLEIMEFYTPQLPTISERVFEAWKKREVEKLNLSLARVLSQQINFVQAEYPNSEMFVFAPKHNKKGKLIGSDPTVLKGRFESPAMIGPEGVLSPIGFPEKDFRLVIWKGLLHREVKITETGIKRNDIDLGNHPHRPEIEANAHFLDVFNALGNEIRSLRDSVAGLPYSRDVSVIRKRVSDLARRFVKTPEKLTEKVTLALAVHGPAGLPLTQLTWARMAKEEDYWQGRKESGILPKPALQNYKEGKAPSTLKSKIRTAVIPLLVAASVFAGHKHKELGRTEAFRALNRTLQEVKDGIGQKLTQVSDQYDERIMQPVGDWAREKWHEMFGEADENGPSDQSSSSGSDDEEAGSKSKAPHVIADNEDHHPASNKGDPSEGADDSKGHYEIIATNLGDVPKVFIHGTLREIRESSHPIEIETKVTSIVPNYFVVGNSPKKANVSKGGIIILPRPEGLIPKRIQVRSPHLEQYIPAKILLTEEGVLYAKIGDGFDGDPMVIVQTYEATKLIPEKDSELAVFKNLPIEKMKQANAELRQMGATKLADQLDELVAEKEFSKQPITLKDLEPRFRGGSLYSYIPARTDETASGFSQMAPFIGPEGYLCYQCDGAADTLKIYLEKVLDGAKPKLLVERRRVLIRADGENTLNQFHRQIRVRLDGGREKVILDPTPFINDPRNPPGKGASDAVEELTPENERMEQIRKRAPIEEPKPEERDEKKVEYEEKQPDPFAYFNYKYNFADPTDPKRYVRRSLNPKEGHDALRRLGLLDEEEEKPAEKPVVAVKAEPSKPEGSQKPAPPKELLELIEARKHLMTLASELPRLRGERALPHLAALQLASASIQFLGNGQPLDGLETRLSEFLRRPVKTASIQEIPALIKEAKEKMAHFLDRHGQHLINQEVAPRFRAIHSSELNSAMDKVMIKLEHYPWTTDFAAAAVATAKTKPVKKSDKACAQALSAMRTRETFELPARWTHQLDKKKAVR